MTPPSTWITRAETTADIPAVREITLAAFETPQEADILDALRADPSWLDGLSLIASTSDGEITGHAVLTRCRIGDVPALCLGPVSVSPEDQRTGAGSAAVRAALSAASARGEHFVVVLGHPSYYPRFGFSRASDFGIRLSVEVPDDALMALSLDGRPIPSGLVHYAAPFGI